MQCVASFGGALPRLPPTVGVSNIGSAASEEGAVTPLANIPLTTNNTLKTSSPASTNSPQHSALDRPTDLCVSPDGLIYVVDFGSSCIRVY